MASSAVRVTSCSEMSSISSMASMFTRLALNSIAWPAEVKSISFTESMDRVSSALMLIASEKEKISTPLETSRFPRRDSTTKPKSPSRSMAWAVTARVRPDSNVRSSAVDTLKVLSAFMLSACVRPVKAPSAEMVVSEPGVPKATPSSPWTSTVAPVKSAVPGGSAKKPSGLLSVSEPTSNSLNTAVSERAELKCTASFFTG
mmetsp:Transcript_4912/g.17534  ORF Transcript_4912/g.17534 Transcript_4912/m.17534 type:complete len:202 (+) Transcript_4912:6206-6811(+)